MTTDTTEWGAPIPVNGKRPVWLADDDKLRWVKEGREGGNTTASDCNWGPYIHSPHGGSVTAIRLPADHWAYTAINAGFEPWAGGGEAPADWDGGDVLLRDGYIGSFCNDSSNWQRGYKGDINDMADLDIIGYRKRVDERSEDDEGDYVRIKRMTWEEWRNTTRFRYDDWADKAGLIKPDPTPAERIANETGIALDIVERVLAAS